MLDTVLRARDKWLAPGGVVFPDRCALHVVAVADPDLYHRRVGFWKDVYGFNMASMAPQVLHEVDVRVVDPDTVVSKPALLHAVDIMTAKLDDIQSVTSLPCPPPLCRGCGVNLVAVDC